MLNEIGTRWERDPGSCIWQPFPFLLPQPQVIGKNTMFHDFPKVSRTRICFLLTLSLPFFYSSLLCFSSVHIVGLLTPKLPLNILYIWFKVSAKSLKTAPSALTKHCRHADFKHIIQDSKNTKSTQTWPNPAGTQNGTSFGRAARVRAST